MTTTTTPETEKPTRANAYQRIVDRILEGIENGGLPPWMKTWDTATLTHINAVTRRPYRGVNQASLSYAGHANPHWLTFNQCRKLPRSIVPEGSYAHVRKGSHGEIVVRWIFPDEAKKGDDATDAPEELIVVDGEEQPARRRGPYCKAFVVFNAEQVDVKTPRKGVLNNPHMDRTGGHRRKPIKLKDAVTPLSTLMPAPKARKRPNKPIEAAEAIVRGIKPRRPRIKTGAHLSPSYSPILDHINMPPIESFITPEEYYRTLFHEIAHWTGHEDRAPRRFGKRKGDDLYAQEELVAELAAAMVSAEAGIDYDPDAVKNSATYIKGWMTGVRSNPQPLVYALQQADRAYRYVLNIDDTPTVKVAA